MAAQSSCDMSKHSNKSSISSEIRSLRKPSVPGRTVCVDHSSILALSEAESVCSHPILKYIDVTLSPTEINFSLGLNDSRLLASLRLCQKFDFGCKFIRHRLANLSSPALVESARLLADAEVHRRCSLRTTHSYEGDADTMSVAQDLYKLVDKSRLPPSMALATKILLGCVVDPVRTVSEYNANNMKNLIHREDVHYHLACAALDSEQWDQFKTIVSSCPTSPHYSPILVFHFVDFAVRNPSQRDNVLEWYFDALSVERTTLTPIQWSKYALSLIKICNWKADLVNITKHGDIEGCVEQRKLSVPREVAFGLHEFQCLKTGLNRLLTGLSKSSGSVTRKEVATLRQSIRSWSKEGERAIIIDSLNVYHGHGNVGGLSPLVRLTKRLASEYEIAVVITRPFLVERLKSVRWHSNVHIFSCTTLSEDDLLILLAAVEWGPNAYVLSNDRFGVHVEKCNSVERILMREWMRRRIVRFNKYDWKYDCLPEYGEFVQQIAPSTFFVPVTEETPGIPIRSAFV
ncbi:hypothetical protein KIN20_019347, partial [Parelaphostrongylus tenuis]